MNTLNGGAIQVSAFAYRHRAMHLNGDKRMEGQGGEKHEEAPNRTNPGKIRE